MSDLAFPSLAEPPATTPAVPAVIELAKIDLTAVALAQYGDWRKDVAATKASLSTLVLDLSTPTKIKEARSLRARMIGEPLANVRKVAAGIKSKMAQTSKALGAELEQIEAAYSEADALILPQIEKREAELERERQERERIEAERRAKHQSAIATIRNYIQLAKGLPSERIAKGLNVVEALDVSPAVFEEFAEQAAAAKAEVLERLTEMHRAAVQAEENARLKAEAEKAQAEARRLEAEAAELRAAAERAARVEEDAMLEGFASAATKNSPEGQGSQQVLKAEPATADATDRDAPADASPVGGPMGAGQAAAAAPAGGSPELAAALDGLAKVRLTPIPLSSPGPITMIEPAAPPADEKPTLKLGDINARIAPLRLDTRGLGSLGFQPAATDRAACLYYASDWPKIKAALIEHLQGLA